MWTKLNFGKYKGKSLPQAVLRDPDWFFWALDDGVFVSKPDLIVEAYELARKARNIKIPKPSPEDWHIRYVIHESGKFGTFDIVERTSHDWEDVSRLFRSDRLDLSFPRRFKEYDKLGCRLLMRAFRDHFFGNKHARLTKQICEEFFSSESNFVLTASNGSGRPFTNHKAPSTWNELAAERKKRVRQIEEENSQSVELDDSGDRSNAAFADPDYFSSLCRQGVISTQECLELMIEQNEGEDELSEEEWLAQLKQEEELSRAEQKKRLEEEQSIVGKRQNGCVL